ncbi:hypothetical protein C1Y40_05752 [Mycobacterium talmoniae]|uniref:Uncharacterized protein n=1 Tax=Mycobacterium talmoniae TaxID=1858794 RepID=A0A2S8BBR0_9MYCO|nr:hypothetical protein C1Y40_05752 [Mycobacterium talmoniae]
MPSVRRIALAVPLVARMASVKISENSSCGPAVARAVGSGRASA